MTLSRVSPPDATRRASSTDWLWGGIGLSIASISASFAAYMIATSPNQVTGSGSKDWTVFVHLGRRTPALASDETIPVRSSIPVAAAVIDPDPTGSIATRSAPIDRTPPPAHIPGRTTPLREYVLREVSGGRALIEHRNKLSLVKPGSVLDDAGEVLAIERQNDAWIVRTAAGIIDGSGSNTR